MSRVLVISPHPDDEAIGCGGTLRQHVLQGDAVRVIFLTSGENGGHGMAPEETTRIREAEARAAAEVLGIREVEFWREPDGSVRVTSRLTDRLRATLLESKPELIYVPHDREEHGDHRAALELVRAGVEAWPAAADKPEVLMFEVWTPLQAMTKIVDISPFVQDKLQAIRSHTSQCAVLRFDEAALALARYRGEMHSWPGGDYAEVFLRFEPTIGRALEVGEAECRTRD